ncbi:hypothetical protein FDP41_003737 [Naegleria fowleri]|uniref:Uncharacterized protein n=1 Tax=Naegleria fowleri TaxID=5763 RepID=A0A6A5BSB8_NAEFO|nr:uncharacterized protein FDP41_003737 [Naegleria fowleri]KAF0977084.1 hypothetical protein FDP41_003737 [Naegleria fowleri]CAG4717628.1 unnamed protein product [Naegleria fowleri]
MPSTHEEDDDVVEIGPIRSGSTNNANSINNSTGHYRHLFPDDIGRVEDVVGNINSHSTLQSVEEEENDSSNDENSQSGSIISDNEDEVSDEDDYEEYEEEEELNFNEKEENVDLREWKIVFPSVHEKQQVSELSSNNTRGDTEILPASSEFRPTHSPLTNIGNSHAFQQNHQESIIVVHDHQTNIKTTNEQHIPNIFIGMPKHERLAELLDPNESPISECTYILQTRSDDPTPYVPDHLYTSLVYQFYQSVLFHEKIRRKYEKVIADIKLVFHDTGEEVVKIVPIPEVNQKPIPANLIPEKQGGSSKEVISGDINGLELIKPISQRDDADSVMENRTKFNVDVVSFHYKHRPFCLQLRYYFPEDYPPSSPPTNNCDHPNDGPFCILHSAPFTTSARRKNSQRMIESKKRKKLQRLIDRKREKLQTHIANQQQQQQAASTTQPATLEDFANKLKELIYFSAVLPKEDQRVAIQAALRSLVQNDKDI